MNLRAWATIGLAGALLAGAAGCQNKITKENFDQIKTGMSPADVKAILGEPTSQQGSAGEIIGVGYSSMTMTWKQGNATLTVTFLNNGVLKKSFEEGPPPTKPAEKK
jgi:outer membrane protein assembly factor BamE (lipoprotein component of BamABCDE complex)